ncbi:DUF4282 domain-containing protein [Desulfoferula mesophila]|uniref:DUF4282 domain-containing protein n=1 Tax=Desulfoferula mesophila TaxID=3058419 RepID=A0AAU9EGB5_9BACT|nr:hypothetical protein FAK_00670 [Desulfoferula mesophilus]
MSNSNPNPIADLFDFSFNKMVTPSYIKVLYILLLVGIGVYCLMSIITGFAAGFGYGLMALVVAAIVTFIGVIFARIYMEVIMVFFRIKELLEGMAQGKCAAPTPPPAPEAPDKLGFGAGDI